MLAAYVFCHYNWQYKFICPSIQEIVEEYKKVNSTAAPTEDESDQEEGVDSGSEPDA